MTKTNNNNTVTNAYNNATENPIDYIHSNSCIYKRSNTFSCPQKPDYKNNWVNNTDLKTKGLSNRQSDRNMSHQIYENAAVITNQSRPSLPFNDVSAKKKPKPLPKPISHRQSHIYMNIFCDSKFDPIYNNNFIYENIPDKIKVNIDQNEIATNTYIRMDPVYN